MATVVQPRRSTFAQSLAQGLGIGLSINEQQRRFAESQIKNARGNLGAIKQGQAGLGIENQIGNQKNLFDVEKKQALGERPELTKDAQTQLFLASKNLTDLNAKAAEAEDRFVLDYVTRTNYRGFNNASPDKQRQLGERFKKFNRNKIIKPGVERMLGITPQNRKLIERWEQTVNAGKQVLDSQQAFDAKAKDFEAQGNRDISNLNQGESEKVVREDFSNEFIGALRGRDRAGAFRAFQKLKGSMESIDLEFGTNRARELNFNSMLKSFGGFGGRGRGRGGKPERFNVTRGGQTRSFLARSSEEAEKKFLKKFGGSKEGINVEFGSGQGQRDRKKLDEQIKQERLDATKRARLEQVQEIIEEGKGFFSSRKTEVENINRKLSNAGFKQRVGLDSSNEIVIKGSGQSFNNVASSKPRGLRRAR